MPWWRLPESVWTMRSRSISTSIGAGAREWLAVFLQNLGGIEEDPEVVENWLGRDCRTRTIIIEKMIA